MRVLALFLSGLLLAPLTAHAGYNTSSHRKDTRAGDSTWNGGAALDGDPTTCWMIEAETVNEGQWLQLDVPVGHVDKISVIGGWVKSEETFSDYARVKKLKVEVFVTEMEGATLLSEQNITLADTNEVQHIELEDVHIVSDIFGGKVKLTVLEVYPGKDYPNLAVSEILVHMREFDALTLVNSVSSAVAGHEGEALVDENARTYWASEGEGAGQVVMIEAPRYGVSSVTVTPGPKAYARPKNISVKVSDIERVITVEDKASPQWFQLPSLIGYTGSVWGIVEMRIIDTYPGTSPGVAISELKLHATNLEDF